MAQGTRFPLRRFRFAHIRRLLCWSYPVQAHRNLGPDPAYNVGVGFGEDRVKKWPFGQGIDPTSRVDALHASPER